MKQKKFKFKKIDAFASGQSSGNPAGTIWLDSKKDITEAEMLKIAVELKGFVSEVGYINKREDGKYNLKYYSSKREVNFCGHATIAMMYELFTTDPDLRNKDRITIITNDGELEVYNRIKTSDAVFIMSPQMKEYSKIPPVNEIAQNLNINVSYINQNFPVKIIDAGLRTLIVPIVSFDAIISISPDLKTLNNFCLDNNIDIIEVFTEETAQKENDYRVRVFSATFGYLEDPATGSGNSAFGYYLINQKLWNRETVIVEQNDQRESFNIVQLQKTDLNNRQRVIFGGSAVKRIDGEYILTC